MKESFEPACGDVRKPFHAPQFLRKASFRFSALQLSLTLGMLLSCGEAVGQVNVVTQHNDNARTGQNLQETILTPSNVNPSQFGQLFQQQVSGQVIAQPLYASQVAIPGKGTHNVVYVATSYDLVYAFDADTNGGTNSAPLWRASLLGNTALVNVGGVLGTPVINLATRTMYVVSSESQTGADIFRLHALDITTGAEKFGGPVQIQASVPGTGSGSVGGVLTFNPTYHIQRPGLLFLNGIVYAAFGSNADQGPWHGWLFSYNGTSLQQIDVFCTTPNGSGGGIWMGGAGLAAEVNNPAKPYGRMFVATANGTFSLTAPDAYSMSVLDFDLAGGTMTLEDQFTPFNANLLSSEDADLGAGGPVLLPTETLASGKTLNALVEVGKSGLFYMLDRDNNNDGSNNPTTEYSPAGLGGFNTPDKAVQELQTPIPAGANWGAGVWGIEAYWNNNIYLSGTDPGEESSLAAYSYVNGVLSSTPTSQGTDKYVYPPPIPSVSANGAADGVVWMLKTDPYPTPGPEILLAYDATNLSTTLYSSSTNLARDNPGQPVGHVVPTIANGKVYVGAVGQISVYGLLGTTPTAPAPIINPSSGTVVFPQTVTITDSAAGAIIYYTTNGSTPNGNSPVYGGPFTVSTNVTVKAVASVTGELQSAIASASYLSPNTPANPVFSVAAGTYSTGQTLTITDSTPGATIYYTIGSSTPTSASTVYTSPIPVPFSETVNAIAIAPGPYASAVVSASYTISPANTIDFSGGFANAQSSGQMIFNGSTDLDDVRLQLTNGNPNEAGSAFYVTPVNIQGFTTNFTFQLSNPSADGITFTIQGVGATALGGYGGSLGYAGIGQSVAIKFDLYSNQGEGADSTGLYTDGATPTVPAINLSSTGINLHSGDFMNAALTYNGTNLTLTLTDAVTLATWSQSFVINIPAIVGSDTAYVGFTGGTGGLSSSQKILTWTYLAGAPAPFFTNGFTGTGLILNGSAGVSGTRLRLINGGVSEAASAYYSTQLNVQQFITSFDFQVTDPVADGLTFVIQGAGPTALGGIGGSLGYAGIPDSVAVKFDFFSAATGGGNSTGLFTNGQQPTTGVISLTPSGINLSNQDIFHTQITYNGTTLTVVITDTVTKATATQTYTVNIPAVVGGATAYVGFTAADGAGVSIQDIVDWMYSPLSSTGPAYSGGFSTSQSQLTLNGGAAFNGSRLRLTDGNANEARSAFFTAPVNIQQFSTNFQFQVTNPSADGFTFTIQGTGPTARGVPGQYLGYGGAGTSGIAKSVAIKFDLFSNAGEGPDSTGLYTNGADPTLPAINLSSTGINLHSGDTFNAQLNYSGTTLTVVITDTVTKASATQSYTVYIPAIVGGPTAYIGFTGGTGGASATQDILNWSYSSQALTGPAFSSSFSIASHSQLTLNGGAAFSGSRLRLTDGNSNEARSAFFIAPVNIQQFTADFAFQLTNPNADGFTFAIQNVGPTALGVPGDYLGYGGATGTGIASSVAIKFDLFNDAGEGPNSTGLYTNGAAPTMPAVNLSSTGINLHSGHIFDVQVTYNGATLTVVVTDRSTGASATQTYSVNIPAVVGGPTAYVGFTGGSGGLTAIQDILSWSYY